MGLVLWDVTWGLSLQCSLVHVQMVTAVPQAVQDWPAIVVAVHEPLGPH